MPWTEQEVRRVTRRKVALTSVACNCDSTTVVGVNAASIPSFETTFSDDWTLNQILLCPKAKSIKT